MSPDSSQRPWLGASADLPGHIPTMITLEERSYLRWLTGEMWNGTGDVVEMGPWLGGSTWLLADGMESNPRFDAGPKLHVVDNFRWRPFMAERADLDLEPDASFRTHFERNLAPKGDLVVVHEAALPDDDSAALAVDGGVRSGDDDLPLFKGESLSGEVAIAFVDGAKSWLALRYLLDELLPRCIPGATLLVFQDYQHWQAFWVPMALAYLTEQAPGALELLHVLEFNTLTFRMKQPIGPAVMDRMPPTVAEVSTEMGLRLLSLAADELDESGHSEAAAVTRLAPVSFLGSKGEWEEAVSAFRDVEGRWPMAGAPSSQLLAARRWLAEQTGTLVRPSWRGRRADWLLRGSGLVAGVRRRLGLQRDGR